MRTGPLTRVDSPRYSMHNLTTLVAIPALLAVSTPQPLTSDPGPRGPRGAAHAAGQDDELDAHGDHFDIFSLWRSERGLSVYADQALDICEEVWNAAGVSGEGRVPIALVEHSRSFREMDPKLPKQTVYTPRLDVNGVDMPAICVTPRLHDRTHYFVGLPPATRRLVALSAAAGALGERVTQVSPESGPRRHRWSGGVLLAAQGGLEAAGYAESAAEDPWMSTGILALQTALANLDATPIQLDPSSDAKGVSPRGAGLLKLALAEEKDTDTAITLPSGKAFCASAGEVARMLLTQCGGDSEQAVLELSALTPRWTVEAGAFGKHPFGWHTAAPRQHDVLMLSAEPLEGDFVLRTEIYLISSDLKALPQADIVIGDQDGDRFLIACSHKEGLYLFRRPGRGMEYKALTEAKESVVPLAKRIPVEVRVDGEVLTISVGGVQLQPQRIKNRSLAGRIGIGAHHGSTILFKPVVIERLNGK